MFIQSIDCLILSICFYNVSLPYSFRGTFYIHCYWLAIIFLKCYPHRVPIHVSRGLKFINEVLFLNGLDYFNIFKFHIVFSIEVTMLHMKCWIW